MVSKPHGQRSYGALLFGLCKTSKVERYMGRKSAWFEIKPQNWHSPSTSWRGGPPGREGVQLVRGLWSDIASAFLSFDDEDQLYCVRGGYISRLMTMSERS